MSENQVAQAIWRRLKPKKMSYIEVLQLSKKALKYTGDVERAIELLEETIDPELSYRENLDQLQRVIMIEAEKMKPKEEEELIAEEKEYIKKRAEELSVTSELKREIESEPYTYDELWDKFKLLVPNAEKYKERFEEEYRSIAALPKDQQLKVLTILARDILREEIAPPKVEKPPRERYMYMPPEEYTDFYLTWMKLYREYRKK